MNYKKIYKDLIIRCKNQNRKKGQNIYYEAHHIKPRCFGGKGDGRNINHSNIVLLTAKEHYIAHLLLVNIYPNSPCMLKALWNMCQTGNKERRKPSARIFERIRNEYISNNKGSKGSFYGKKHTKESLIKIGEASKGRNHNLGRKHTEESKKKISNSRVGKIFLSQETKEKISKSISGGNHYNAIPVICTKTGKIFGSGKEVSTFTNIPFSTVRRYLNGTSKTPDFFHYIRKKI